MSRVKRRPFYWALICCFVLRRHNWYRDHFGGWYCYDCHEVHP